jgi:16S rRNA (cytidine1402-2'-O)-methyltransferase
VTPIVGPSSVTALISVSGFSSLPWIFCGFFPRAFSVKAMQKKDTGNYLWFESANRILKTMQFFADYFPDNRVIVAKEMTKLHETFFVGSAKSVYQQLQSAALVGEWCFSLEWEQPEQPSDWEKACLCLIQADVSAKKTSELISDQFGISKNTVYAYFLSHHR